MKLGDELDNSFKHIVTALKELQTTAKDTSYKLIFFQLLSSGIERLLKCTKIFAILHKENRFPTLKEIQTHDILGLFNEIKNNYFVWNNYMCTQDKDFLEHDEYLIEILGLLSKFAQYDRYYNLNIVVGEKTNDIDLSLSELSSKYINDRKDLMTALYDEPDYEFLDNEITRFYISIIERFIRGIAAQYIHGNLGDEPKRLMGDFSHFVMMNNEDLGKTDYYKKYFYKEIK